MGLAGLLLLVELFRLELVIADDAPVVARCIHWEAWRQRAVDANDHRVLSGAAVPGKVLALHESDHLPEPGVGVDHLVSGVLLFGQPLYRLLHRRPVIARDVGNVVIRVLEVLVLR